MRVLGFGLGETGMDDYFGFGLWITFDLAVIALGAGAFFTGALRYILNIDELKNIVNLAAVIGFLCYTGAMMILVLDIGQPIRCWFGYWYPNVHSMLTEVIFCITCYCIVLILEFVPLVLENRQLMKRPFIHALAHNFHVYMPIFAGMGAFLSTFHQGSLGGMYGVLFARPYALPRGLLHLALDLLPVRAVRRQLPAPCSPCSCARSWKRCPAASLVTWEVKQLMGKVGGAMLVVYTVFKLPRQHGTGPPDMLAGRRPRPSTEMFHGMHLRQSGSSGPSTPFIVVPMPVLPHPAPAAAQAPVIFYTDAHPHLRRASPSTATCSPCRASPVPVMPFDSLVHLRPQLGGMGKLLPRVRLRGHGAFPGLPLHSHVPAGSRAEQARSSPATMIGKKAAIRKKGRLFLSGRRRNVAPLPSFSAALFSPGPCLSRNVPPCPAPESPCFMPSRSRQRTPEQEPSVKRRARVLLP